MSDVTDTPSSPPAYPTISVGLGTKLGVMGAAAFGLAGGVAAILHGDHSLETITAMGGSAAVLYGVIRGRMDQAAAALANRQSPGEVLTTFVGTGER